MPDYIHPLDRRRDWCAGEHADALADLNAHLERTSARPSATAERRPASFRIGQSVLAEDDREQLHAGRLVHVAQRDGDGEPIAWGVLLADGRRFTIAASDLRLP